MTDLTGRCLCGAITFRVTGPVRGESLCHCGQCRRQSGHVWASGVAARSDVEIRGETLRWFAASPAAERGFCATCGGFLFWSARGEASISFALGALDTPTGLRVGKHIYLQDKGDYYDITDDLPQHAS
jgi:hypothetical protein